MKRITSAQQYQTRAAYCRMLADLYGIFFAFGGAEVEEELESGLRKGRAASSPIVHSVLFAAARSGNAVFSLGYVIIHNGCGGRAPFCASMLIDCSVF